MRNVFWLRKGVIGGRSGPNRDAWCARDLAAGGIGAVLSVNDGEFVHVDELAEAGIDYGCVPLSDAAPPDPADLEICVNALPHALSFVLRSIERHRSVLVHCSSGKDRTGMFLSYFLCATEGLTPGDAILEVRRVRPIALSAGKDGSSSRTGCSTSLALALAHKARLRFVRLPMDAVRAQLARENHVMGWTSIPRTIPRWLHRHPLALTMATTSVNRFRRLGGRRVSSLIAITVLAALLFAFVTATDWPGLVIEQALNYSAAVVAASGLYAASLTSGHRRTIETVRAHSWLVATPLASPRPMRTLFLIVLPLVWRTVAALVLALLLSLDSSIGVEQSLQLGALIAVGTVVGGPCGWWLSRSPSERAKPPSRYTPRRKAETSIAPSSDALALWPIAQAFAWGRPENARLLLGAAILSIPGGTGILGALLILGTWTVGSYLGGLLIAIPHVGSSALQWLRSTPITFRDFAWPLVRRALLHQVIGTFAAVGVASSLGASLSMATYLGAIWLALVLLIWTISLADAYRARPFATKTAMSALAALLAEARVHGLGISIAVFVAVLHLRLGATHERA